MKKRICFILGIGLFFSLSSCSDDDQMVDLPESIISYISSNYPEYQIDESEIETSCTGDEVYEVEIEISNDDELELTFNSKGSFLYSGTEIENSSLPSAVMDGISSNYGDHSMKEAERLDMADDSTQYEVELKDGSTELEVIFDLEGNVICEQVDEE